MIERRVTAPFYSPSAGGPSSGTRCPRDSGATVPACTSFPHRAQAVIDPAMSDVVSQRCPPRAAQASRRSTLTARSCASRDRRNATDVTEVVGSRRPPRVCRRVRPVLQARVRDPRPERRAACIGLLLPVGRAGAVGQLADRAVVGELDSGLLPPCPGSTTLADVAWRVKLSEVPQTSTTALADVVWRE